MDIASPKLNTLHASGICERINAQHCNINDGLYINPTLSSRTHLCNTAHVFASIETNACAGVCICMSCCMR